GGRPDHARGDRELSAGVHARRADQHRAVDRGATPTRSRANRGGAAMNGWSWLVWGFASTIVLTTLMSGSQGLGMTRMNIPYMLGTMFTPDRDRAKVLGVALHVLNGFAFSLVYVAAFHVWGGPAWWKGGLIGLVHAAFVLMAAMPAMPG